MEKLYIKTYIESKPHSIKIIITMPLKIILQRMQSNIALVCMNSLSVHGSSSYSIIIKVMCSS